MVRRSRRIIKSRPTRVEESPPRRDEQMLPRRDEETAPKRVEQTPPTPFLERRRFLDPEVRELLRLKPLQLTGLKKNLEEEWLKGTWEADDNGTVKLRAYANATARESIAENVAAAWKDRFGGGQGPRDDVSDQIVVHILKHVFNAVKKHYEERATKSAAQARKNLHSESAAPAKKRKIGNIDTTTDATPTLTSQDRNTQNHDTTSNSAQGLALKTSTPLNHMMLCISREKGNAESSNSAGDINPAVIELTLPNLHMEGMMMLDNVQQVSFARLELLARQELLLSPNGHDDEHDQIKFSYINPLDGKLDVIEDSFSLQFAIAFFARLGHWEVALKIRA
ncbi:hypothetical protein SLS58_010532 [Diplodia intermedia]|uniref:Uncharacterized protein n=1 Tax=Diplodia intermedia TaxID=856260 RepID=A0ABR3T5E0_9PEZI